MQIIVDNLAVHYRDEGSGKTVVLLHGWQAGLETFDDLAKELSSHHRVVRLDWPGFGRSQRPGAIWGISDYAKLLAAFLEKIDAQPFCLLGHSFGGRVVIKAAADKLIGADRIVLVDSGGIKKSQSLRNQALKVVAKTGKAATAVVPGLRNKLRTRLYKTIGSTDYLEAGPMREIFLKTINEDLQDDAGKVTTPTLLIWGKDDTETPVSDGRLLAGKIAGAKLEILDGGHFIYLDRPNEVTNLVRRWLG